MTSKEFIERAIEGGWEYNEFPKLWGKVPFKHFNPKTSSVVFLNPITRRQMWVQFSKILLDPIAWQAVGKVEGWKSPYNIEIQTEWSKNMHRMIDALCEGKTIEEFLETL